MKAVLTAALVTIGLISLGAAPPATLRGFSAQSSARERAIDAQFIDIPSAQSALDAARTIGARAHYAGTPGDYALAVSMRDRMRADGLIAELEAFNVRVDTPRELILEFSPPANALPARRGHRHSSVLALDLAERGQPGDPPTNDRSIGLPFNAGSADGDIRAPIVYVNRGREADYAVLRQAGVDVHGAIALIRYGAEFRGLLAQRAQRHGASGAIFYSDPSDDGFARGPAVPGGPWRPLTSVERGSVGTGVTIPTLPVSALNAQVLLASVHGDAAPLSWTGGLPVAYPLGRGTDPLHFVVKLNRKTTTLWNTVGTVPGVHADQQVILGAQRDASVYGVGDNGAGITTMLELARGFGFLMRGGWRPQRSIVIAGWDGDEIESAGAQGYERRHHIEIERGCVAYLDADRSVTGSAVRIDSAAALAPLIVDAARNVKDPAVPSSTLYDRWLAAPARDDDRRDDHAGESARAPLLGLGTIPVANIRFEGPFGVYHSSYDTLQYALHFSDPEFELHRAAAQLYGLIALHLADADAVPYSFGSYANDVRSEIERFMAHGGGTRAIDNGNLAPATARLAGAAVRIDARIEAADTSIFAREVQAVQMLNALLYGSNAGPNAKSSPVDAMQTLVRATSLMDGR